MAKQPVTQGAALKIIRTWAAFERDHPEVDVLVPAHVLRLCDEALGIAPTPPAPGHEREGRQSPRCTCTADPSITCIVHPQEVPDGGR